MTDGISVNTILHWQFHYGKIQGKNLTITFTDLWIVLNSLFLSEGPALNQCKQMHSPESNCKLCRCSLIKPYHQSRNCNPRTVQILRCTQFPTQPQNAVQKYGQTRPRILTKTQTGLIQTASVHASTSCCSISYRHHIMRCSGVVSESLGYHVTRVLHLLAP